MPMISEDADIQGVFLCTLTLGFGPLNHGFWPSMRVFGTQNLGVQHIKGTNLKSLRYLMVLLLLLA